MGKNESQLWRWSAMLLALTVTACGTLSVPPPAEPARIPALPPEGRVSLLPTPSECLPSCLSGLTVERNRSLDMLTGSGSPGKPANATETDYRLPLGGKLMSPNR